MVFGKRLPDFLTGAGEPAISKRSDMTILATKLDIRRGADNMAG
jgi:hypothetical protein